MYDTYNVDIGFSRDGPLTSGLDIDLRIFTVGIDSSLWAVV